MFIPLGTNRPPKRSPLVTQGLIVTNMAVYLISAIVGYSGESDDAIWTVSSWGHFAPYDFKVWQLLTYQFIHDPTGIFHILFNMLFLWVFGAAVESRLGRIGFLVFYLIGGVVAALAHAVVNSLAPVIGASGSIAGVTGAFLALYPRSRIKVVAFFIVIGAYWIPAVWLIGLYFALDLFRQFSDFVARRGSGVAYAAHLAGYMYGFGIAFLLLATRVLKREEFDVFFMFKQWKRRAEFKAASRQGPAGMWTSAQADTSKRLEQRKKKSPELKADDAHTAALRADISRLYEEHQIDKAAEKYKELLASAGNHVLTESRMLDIANHYFGSGEYQLAARVYALYLDKYPHADTKAEIRLMLGLLYARHLNRPDDARLLLEHVQERAHDDARKELARSLLEELAA